MQPEEPKQAEVNDGRPWIAIFLNEDNTMKVTGHIHDRILAYGILAAAKEAISKSIEKQNKIHRVNSSGGLLDMLRARG